MNNPYAWCVVTLLLAGCGSTSLFSNSTSQPPFSTSEDKATTASSTTADCACSAIEVESTRALLNPGYAQLAAILNGLAWTDEMLLVKLESDVVEAVGVELAEMAASFADELESLADAEEQVLLDNDGFPPIEKRKQKAMLKQWVQDYLPLVGMEGFTFERTLLLRSAGAINQVRYLSQVMREEEPLGELGEYLGRLETASQQMHSRIIGVLESGYFVANASD